MAAQGTHVRAAAASPVQGRLRSKTPGRLRRGKLPEEGFDQAEVELPLLEPSLSGPRCRTGPVGLVLHTLVMPAQVPVQPRILLEGSLHVSFRYRRSGAVF